MAVAQRESEARSGLVGTVHNLRDRVKNTVIGKPEPDLTSSSDEFIRKITIDITRDHLMCMLTQCGTKVENQVLVGLGNEYGMATIVRGALDSEGKFDEDAAVVFEYPYTPIIQLFYKDQRARFCAVLPEYMQKEGRHEPFYVINTADGQEQIVPNIDTKTLVDLEHILDRHPFVWPLSEEAASDFLATYTNFDELDRRYQVAQNEKRMRQYEDLVLSFLRRTHLNSSPGPFDEGYWNEP